MDLCYDITRKILEFARPITYVVVRTHINVNNEVYLNPTEKSWPSAYSIHTMKYQNMCL